MKTRRVFGAVGFAAALITIVGFVSGKFTLRDVLGELIIRRLTISPGEPPTPILRIDAAPNPQLKGEKVTLTWTARDADSVVITGLGEVPPRGSHEMTVSEAHTYEITASNRFHKTASARITVSVQDWPVPILSLRADPNPVVRGTETTVSWASKYATHVLIEPLGVVNLSGSAPLRVDASLTVTARAQGPGGNKQVDLVVEAVVPPSKKPQMIVVATEQSHSPWARSITVEELEASLAQSPKFQVMLHREMPSSNSERLARFTYDQRNDIFEVAKSMSVRYVVLAHCFKMQFDRVGVVFQDEGFNSHQLTSVVRIQLLDAESRGLIDSQGYEGTEGPQMRLDQQAAYRALARRFAEDFAKRLEKR